MALTTIEDDDEYMAMEHHEHILDKTDSYIGSIEEDDINMYVFDDEKKKIINKTIKYVPGLYKIFDEIIVNARDQTVRDPTCNIIKVTINKDTGYISCYNNGDNGIPVRTHKKMTDKYIPEIIFGILLTSSNYKKTGKTVGGRNGYGAKLANIFSDEFTVETVDAERQLKFIQTYTENMYKKTTPQITKTKKSEKSYTKITFKPDYKRLNMPNGLSDDVIQLFKKRTYDIAATTNTTVFFNDEKITIGGFQNYIKMFFENDVNVIYDEPNTRWRIGVIFDPNGGLKHHSYVNGICTFQGGIHVNYVVDQVTKNLQKIIETKHKDLKIKPDQIKSNLTFFIDATIEDPAFNSQIKEYLTTKVSKFGSKFDVSAEFIKKLSLTGITDEVVSLAKYRAQEDFKKTDGKRTIVKLHKYDPAKKKGKGCTLILTEGDSAKAFAVAGIEVLGNDNFGVFPLRGKLLNTREASAKQLLENEEIKNIKQIMGLKTGAVYTKDNIHQKLNYDSILIMTDQDLDGYHIKGLLINFIHTFWPSLITIDGFLRSMNTPILKAFKKTNKKEVIPFYNLIDYENWKKDVNTNLWKIKYYKGLGTHDKLESKLLFQNDFEKLLVKYIDDNKIEQATVVVPETHSESESDVEAPPPIPIAAKKVSKTDDTIRLAFEKTRANDRKKWILDHDKNEIPVYNKEISYVDFINKDLILYSESNVIRSIPSICDGFKPSQRKILYAAFIKKLFKDEMKVAQFAGAVGELTAYHHGEASLFEAIIKMAQNFVGSNNINPLVPSGMFGTRREGGCDHASPRYIFTLLNELTPLLFRQEDECVLKQCEDDGALIEYEHFAPILPNVLINGCDGIATGWSTSIPCFNPLDVIKIVKAYINNTVLEDIHPWYNKFTGNIKKHDKDKQKYISQGIYSVIDENTIKITELPIGIWTSTYFAFLDTLLSDGPKTTGVAKNRKKILKNYDHSCGNDTINITLTFMDGELTNLIKTGKLEHDLKLCENITMTNMHLHDAKNKIKKYDSITEIVIDFCKYRMDVYDKRKEHYSKILENQMNVIYWKIKFIEEFKARTIILFDFETKVSKKKEEVIAQLIAKKYPELSVSNKDNKSYNYITSLTLFSLTDEEAKKLKDEHTTITEEYNKYKSTPVKNIWLNEINEFETAYKIWLENMKEEESGIKVKKAPKKRAAAVKK